MNKSEKLKIEYEITTCKTFLSLYKKDTIFIKHGNPNKKEPDCICSNNTSIELVGIYDNENQAKQIWNNENIDIKNKKNFNIDSFKNLYKNILEKLEKLNDDLYSGSNGKIILLCDLLSPNLKQKDIKKYIELYIPFKKEYRFTKYFDEIWILWGNLKTNKYKIKRLE